jgi:hypothetical protein
MQTFKVIRCKYLQAHEEGPVEACEVDMSSIVQQVKACNAWRIFSCTLLIRALCSSLEIRTPRYINASSLLASMSTVWRRSICMNNDIRGVNN